MRIVKSTLPNNSILHASHKEFDYVDSFQGELKDANNSFNSVSIGKAFFSSEPKWVDRLYFLFIRPFHKRIVPAMLKGIIKELEK